MRTGIIFFYRILFFTAIFCVSFLIVYGCWLYCDTHFINIANSYFDVFPSYPHDAVIVGVPLLFSKQLLSFADKQAVFIYKNYVERIVYLRYFVGNFIFQLVVMLCLTVGVWKLCSVFNINLFNDYFNNPLSPEHNILAFFMTVFGFKTTIKKSKNVTEKIFFKYYETEGRLISTQTRAYVYRRDRGKCRECGSKRKLEYDHVKPHSKGGSNRAYNIQLLCMGCNRKKSNKY